MPKEELRDLRAQLLDTDILSQILDGFTRWLLQLDPTVNLEPDPATAEVTGLQDTSALPHANNFQPVRAVTCGSTNWRSSTVSAGPSPCGTRATTKTASCCLPAVSSPITRPTRS
ncbi:hypothetical protein [Streptomyces lavendulae]|uniref:hypothetical protein n=1 Tax=Streptomyces lavendulae TaxID=1914 RepID=UPI003819E6A1